MSDFETDCALVRDNLDATGRASFDRIYAEMNRLRKKNASITRLRNRMSKAEDRAFRAERCCRCDLGSHNGVHVADLA